MFTPPIDNLNNISVTKTFDITIYSYEFELKDYSYTLDGTKSILEITPFSLDPNPNPSIDLIYTSTLADGSEFPTNLLTFDSAKLEFTIESAD